MTRTHLMSNTRTYNAWREMKARCQNPKNSRFHRYGGRGIKVCDRWLESFENFYRDMGECPPKLTLDRMNNNGNYEPGNCRWATAREQSQNTSRVRFLTHNGETLPLGEWARRLGMNAHTITMRLNKYGWSVADALSKTGAKKHV